MNARPESQPASEHNDTARIWADWVTVWQSEMAAMATDREVQDSVQRGIDLWAAQAIAIGHEPPARPAGSAAAAGATPALAPSRNGKANTSG